MDTGRCPTPCPNPIEVVRLGQLFFCCSRSGASPSSRACSVLFPALQLSRTAVCAATELSVRCCQDLSNLQTTSVLRPDRRGELVVTDALDIYTLKIDKGQLLFTFSGIFDSFLFIAPTLAEMRLQLMEANIFCTTTNGSIAWLAEGINIEEIQ